MRLREAHALTEPQRSHRKIGVAIAMGLACLSLPFAIRAFWQYGGNTSHRARFAFMKGAGRAYESEVFRPYWEMHGELPPSGPGSFYGPLLPDLHAPFDVDWSRSGCDVKSFPVDPYRRTRLFEGERRHGWRTTRLEIRISSFTGEGIPSVATDPRRGIGES